MDNLIIDFENLLTPILGDCPVGADLRIDNTPTSLYYQIKDARNLARLQERRLRQGETTDNNVLAIWQKVRSLGKEILATKSKDLEVCVWLIESLLREYQFAGLKDGFMLARQLCERYWETLYPLPDEEGFLSRLAPLGGLNGDETNGTLIDPLFNVPLSSSNKYGSFAFWQYQQAKTIDQIADPDKRARRSAETNVDLSTVESAVADTSVDFLKNLVENLKSCLVEYQTLISFLDQKCGNDAPPSSRINEALKSALEIIQYLSRNILVEESIEVSDDTSKDGKGSLYRHDIQGREEALQSLGRIADFFLTTEPHSPLSYLIRKVVRWGRLPLPTLLHELIVDERVRDQAFILTGIEEEQNQN